MTSLWIVHREPYYRAALGRLAAAPGSTLEGPPGDACFDPERAPEVVVLGLSGDLESELEFAHRTAPRMRLTGWSRSPSGTGSSSRGSSSTRCQRSS